MIAQVLSWFPLGFCVVIISNAVAGFVKAIFRDHRWEEEIDRHMARAVLPESPEARAEHLLGRVLGPAALKQYRQSREVKVKGSEGGQYVVGEHWTRDSRGRVYCVYALTQYEGGVPAADNVLSLAMALKSNERDFLRRANRH